MSTAPDNAAMSTDEIKAIGNGDSVVINGIAAVYQDGRFYDDYFPLVVDEGDYTIKAWHSGISGKFLPLNKNRLWLDKIHYHVTRGGDMTLEKRIAIGKSLERIYGES